MHSKSVCGAIVMCLALAAPAAADVTLKQKSTGKVMGNDSGGDATVYLKGLKMRTDNNVGGAKSTIIDVATRQMIILDHAKKQADILDMAKLAETLSKAGVNEIQSSITPTGQTRQIAGATCTVYDVKMSVPMAMGMPMTMVLAGPHCLVKNGPGQADYAAFYKAAAENGFVLDAAQAKGQPGIAKGMMDMQRKLGELGMPYASEMNISIEAEGPMAAAMKKMNNTISSEMVSVTTGAVPDSMFVIPADYKVNKR
jgi:uncharacterized protein DUF4412